MIICIFGRRGEGKTTWIKKNVVRPSLLPCVIVDTLREYKDEAILMPITPEISFTNFKIRYVPNSDMEFNMICEGIQNKYHYGLNFIISEVDFWTSSNYIPTSFLNCLRYSRHYNLNIICDVRNPMELNRKISALADKFIIFKITEPRYLDYFGLYNSSLIQKIQNLEKHQYIEYEL